MQTRRHWVLWSFWEGTAVGKTERGQGQTACAERGIVRKGDDIEVKAYRHILFDLDGTLTDPKEGIINSIQFALSHFGMEPADPNQLEHFIGPPLQQSFQQYFGFSQERAWEAVEAYRRYFRSQGMFENYLYPGIYELLEELVMQGRCLFVVTSKPQVFAEPITEQFGIDRFFCGIYGSELDGTHSDKAALIGHVLRSEQLPREGVIMVGDRRFDVEGATANGIDSAAVGWGYGTAEELAEAQPTHLFNSVGELRNALGQGNGAATAGKGKGG